jgi:hypothetical protein
MRSIGILLVFTVVSFAESAAGLKWTAPAGWTSQGRTSMRAATYAFPATPGDNGPSECVVYFFGAGQGGTIEANLDRWKGQFTQPDGKPAAAKVEKRTIHGLPVTTIETAGNYSGMGGPMAQSHAAQPGYRMLGAIVEGPGGNLFLKLTGPGKAITGRRAQFEQLLNSFAKE